MLDKKQGEANEFHFVKRDYDSEGEWNLAKSQHYRRSEVGKKSTEANRDRWTLICWRSLLSIPSISESQLPSLSDLLDSLITTTFTIINRAKYIKHIIK